MTKSGAACVELTRDLIDIIIELDEFFANSEKTLAWLTTVNPMLGGIEPVKMLERGRGQKLWALIRNLKEGNIA
jgi:hypothetical protein